MAIYTVQDTTMTALGDAVRSKVGNYTVVDEIPTPTFDISFDTREMEEYKIKYDIRIFTFPLNFKEMFGDELNKITKLHISCNYESYVGGTFTYWAGGGLSIRFDNSIHSIAAHSSKEPLNGEVDFILEIPAPYWNASNIRVELRGNDWAFTDEPYDAWFKANFKIWAMVSEDNYFTYNSLTPLEMVENINNLMTIPDEVLNITGDCRYRFAYNSNNWLIEKYGDKITTKDISIAENMFAFSDKLTSIPFEINLKDNTNIQYLFNNCSSLKYYPQVNLNLTQHISFGQVFQNNTNLREIPEWFIDLLEQDINIATNNTTFAPWNNLFSYCFSLRTIPDRAMKAMYNPNPSGQYYTIAYCNPFRDCYTLDELINIPCDNYAFTSNQFNRYFFLDLYRAKNITFATNEDSTPLIRNWKLQTLDLTNYVGYYTTGGYAVGILGYNSGITADKEVKDDATYQALKDDPDWYSLNINYSRYNHDSAVNTINSLPDCSSSGGTNTIKFKGQSGALTDGGAINTLTEEEIAVATSRGWTVSLV